MDDIEQFVKGLGPHGKQYTPDELTQLHGEVRKLAEVLLAAHQAKAQGRRKPGSPQPVLDESGSDRTISAELTEHADGSPPSGAQEP